MRQPKLRLAREKSTKSLPRRSDDDTSEPDRGRRHHRAATGAI